MIEIKNLCKTYKVKEKSGFLTSKTTYLKAVKNLNMQVPDGAITGLLGINGAGKTTTIKMLSTLLEPTSGEIIYNNLPLKKHENEIKKKVNMIAGGERMIYWRLTARENLKYFGSLYALHGKALSSRIDELLELTGLTEKADIPVEKYSKGMKQRLQIARGLINNPNYIFLDEPTLGLDVPIAKEMRAFFDTLAHKQGKGIVLTTHYMQEVEELCDYIYILDKGELIYKGTPSEIISLHTDIPNAKLEDAILNISNKVKEVV